MAPQKHYRAERCLNFSVYLCNIASQLKVNLFSFGNNTCFEMLSSHVNMLDVFLTPELQQKSYFLVST